jgi:hypothetical protein
VRARAVRDDLLLTGLVAAGRAAISHFCRERMGGYVGQWVMSA